MITDPYRLLDCCLETDGAAAYVVTSVERARDLGKTPIYIMGAASGQPYPADEIMNRPEFHRIGLTTAAPEAFAMAGVRPQDADFAQIYDCFTFEVIQQIEEAGFCARGEGGAFVENGGIELGGRLPVNPSGGLKAKGHPIGATGVSMHVLAAMQLMGEAGEMQVPGAELAGVFNMGGSAVASYVSILERAR